METLKVRFKYPFEKAGERLKREALSRADYDPASLFRWGTMLALAVLEMLKAAERELGESGQRAMIEALVGVGKEVGRQMLLDLELPKDLEEPIELISAYASWINREVYASPEDPRIDDRDHCSFDILWCPHQDCYKAFDCRVQRYLVQGMMEAMREKFPGPAYNIQVKRTIPAGAKVCTFEIGKRNPDEPDDWNLYSDSLAKKALELAAKKGP